MGQYHFAVNLDRQEFIDPNKLGAGLKLWEQLANPPGVGAALIVLLASGSNGRGGGDLNACSFRVDNGNPIGGTGKYRKLTPTKAAEMKAAHAVIGSWCGNRIAFVGDYDENSTYLCGLAPAQYETTGDQIYSRLGAEGSPWRDVTDLVCKVIEVELDGTFDQSRGWASWKLNDAA